MDRIWKTGLVRSMIVSKCGKNKGGDTMELKPCPFCGGKKLVRSVDGGILPSFIDADKQYEIFEKTPYVTTCELSCELCGAQVEGYAASNNLHDDLYEKAIKVCYEKWNRRVGNDG